LKSGAKLQINVVLFNIKQRNYSIEVIYLINVKMKMETRIGILIRCSANLPLKIITNINKPDRLTRGNMYSVNGLLQQGYPCDTTLISNPAETEFHHNNNTLAEN
jgi:hypothetical protein